MKTNKRRTQSNMLLQNKNAKTTYKPATNGNIWDVTRWNSYFNLESQTSSFTCLLTTKMPSANVSLIAFEPLWNWSEIARDKSLHNLIPSRKQFSCNCLNHQIYNTWCPTNLEEILLPWNWMQGYRLYLVSNLQFYRRTKLMVMA